jgi:hypothetical protein
VLRYEFQTTARILARLSEECASKSFSGGNLTVLLESTPIFGDLLRFLPPFAESLRPEFGDFAPAGGTFVRAGGRFAGAGGRFARAGGTFAGAGGSFARAGGTFARAGGRIAPGRRNVLYLQAEGLHV